MHGRVLIVEIGNNHPKCIESSKNSLVCSDLFAQGVEKPFSTPTSSTTWLAAKMRLGLRKKEEPATPATRGRTSSNCRLNKRRGGKHYRIGLWRVLRHPSMALAAKEKTVIRLTPAMLKILSPHFNRSRLSFLQKSTSSKKIPRPSPSSMYLTKL